MARAYFAPYGVGLGHDSRLVTIANRLNDYDASIDFHPTEKQDHSFKCMASTAALYRH
jgi:hypothetical protein